MMRDPFSRRTVLGLLLVGGLAFVALLYSIGTGSPGGNDGGGHAAGRGLNGYAALAALLEEDGHQVRKGRTRQDRSLPGLLVLTPPAGAEGADIDEIVSARRTIGPTLVVTPKWQAVDAKASAPRAARRGWVSVTGTGLPRWEGFRDDIVVRVGGPRDAPAGGWSGGGYAGTLPDDRQVLSGSGGALIPLVETGDGRVLAAYADDGDYPELDAFAGIDARAGDTSDARLYPLVFVFEPDLLDNWGMARPENAALARALVVAALDGESAGEVTFDVSLNGLGASRNLLTLAFEPPFLAATACLLLAVFAAGWRGFNRFGPARVPERVLAAGKAALVANSAGLIRRAGRVHLVAAPYADALRERIAAALGIHRTATAGETEAAIDRALERRGHSGPGFAERAAALRAARKPHDVVRRARALQQIEKELT